MNEITFDYSNTVGNPSPKVNNNPFNENSQLSILKSKRDIVKDNKSALDGYRPSEKRMSKLQKMKSRLGNSSIDEEDHNKLVN